MEARDEGVRGKQAGGKGEQAGDKREQGEQGGSKDSKLGMRGASWEWGE